MQKKKIFKLICTLFIFSYFALNPSLAFAAGEFITTWKTDNPGTSNSDQITIPTDGISIYNYNVDWGDSSTSMGVTGDITHTYGTAGTYTVAITGTFPHIFFNYGGDASKILSIEQWGDQIWTSMAGAFAMCNNLIINAVDEPNLLSTTNMGGMFYGATSLNQDISGWDVSNINYFDAMFANATNFDQDISGWNTSSAIQMGFMFQNATQFNQNIGGWDVSQVTHMGYMFNGATNFNGNIGAWDTSHTIYMNNMFKDAASFNQDISGWNVGNVSTMENMFWGATSFNQNIGGWNVSSVANMSGMFYADTAFNQNLNLWDVSSVLDMSNMFTYATTFNGNISAWNTANVTNMNSMFSITSFNQDITGWNLGNAQSLSSMFAFNTAFNQDISVWDVSNITDMNGMFIDVTLPMVNYDSLLNAWSLLPLQNGVPFHGGNSVYTTASQAARAVLTDTFGWFITDGGLASSPSLTTAPASAITRTSVTLNGEITSTGNVTPTTRGFNYGETNLYGSTTSESGSFDPEVFSLDISGLSCGTTYHFNAFATNSMGTSSSADDTFTTSACASTNGVNGGSSIISIITQPIINIITPIPPASNPTTQQTPTHTPIEAKEPTINPHTETKVDPIHTEVPAEISPGTYTQIQTDTTKPAHRNTEATFSKITDKIRVFIQDPTIKTLGKISLTIPLLVSVTLVARLISSGVSIFNFLYYLIFLLPQLLRFKKRPNPWGVVYDSRTKRPLAFTKVNILSVDKRILASTITDIEGRYGFLIAKKFIGENIEIQSEQKSYTFPSVATPTETERILYTHVYKGGPVVATNQLTNYDIPMDPQKPMTKPAPYFKIVSIKLNNIWLITTDVLFITGLIYSVINYSLAPSNSNFVLIALTLSTYLLRLSGFNIKSFGLTTDKTTKELLPFGLIALHQQDGERINFTVSDDMGRYFLLVPSGKYVLKAYTPSHITPTRQTELNIKTNKGWIDERLSL